MGAEKRFNCENMQALLTIGARVPQTQHGLRGELGRENGVERAETSVVSRIQSLTGVHGHVAAALLVEMQDVQGSACFENCETEFRYSRCIRQGRVEAPVLWGARGQIRVKESRGKVEGQRMETSLRRGQRQRVRAAGHDVGGHLLAILRQQGETGVHGE